MKTLYIECAMGAAGDMLMGALSELTENADAFVEEMNALNLPDVSFSREKAVRCGIVGTHMNVRINGLQEHEHVCAHDHEHIHADAHDHEHGHGHTHAQGHSHAAMSDIRTLIEGLKVSEHVKQRALEAYGLIAQAEALAHGQPVENIHFHEVGTADAVADVVGVVRLMELINPERVVVSPINVGGGLVQCAHGLLPVPAPATAYILRGVPIYGSGIRGELCTPTGAALLKVLADDFGPMPLMRVSAIGYGMGTREFPAANCVRAYIGEEAR